MAHAILTTELLDMAAIVNLVRSPRCGGYVTFAGDVRDHDSNGTVTKIDYVAYDELARKEMLRIAKAAEDRWPECSCALAHRTGELLVGETSVIVAVAAPHRAEAFEACRWIIDTMKTEAPIWKREELVDGERVWIEAHERVVAQNGAAQAKQQIEATQP
jgi:molybdopterin synthase catalytic subunit